MDPQSDRIVMNLGTWYGSVEAMIEAVKTAGCNAVTAERAYEIAGLMQTASQEILWTYKS